VAEKGVVARISNAAELVKDEKLKRSEPAGEEGRAKSCAVELRCTVKSVRGGNSENRDKRVLLLSTTLYDHNTVD